MDTLDISRGNANMKPSPAAGLGNSSIKNPSPEIAKIITQPKLMSGKIVSTIIRERQQRENCPDPGKSGKVYSNTGIRWP